MTALIFYVELKWKDNRNTAYSMPLVDLYENESNESTSWGGMYNLCWCYDLTLFYNILVDGSQI